MQRGDLPVAPLSCPCPSDGITCGGYFYYNNDGETSGCEKDGSASVAGRFGGDLSLEVGDLVVELAVLLFKLVHLLRGFDRHGSFAGFIELGGQFVVFGFEPVEFRAQPGGRLRRGKFYVE